MGIQCAKISDLVGDHAFARELALLLLQELELLMRSWRAVASIDFFTSSSCCCRTRGVGHWP